MNDDITIIEIVLWALRHQRDEVGDYLDLSDDELQNLLDRCLVAQGHESIHRDITDGFMAKRQRAMDDAVAKRDEINEVIAKEYPNWHGYMAKRQRAMDDAMAKRREETPNWLQAQVAGLRALQARVAGLEDEDEDELLQDLERLRRMFDE